MEGNPEAKEVHPTTKEDHPGAMEARPRATGLTLHMWRHPVAKKVHIKPRRLTHHGDAEANLQATEAHARAVKACPGVNEAHPDVIETHYRAVGISLETLRLTL
jgi:hypothetical protein